MQIFFRYPKIPPLVPSPSQVARRWGRVLPRAKIQDQLPSHHGEATSFQWILCIPFQLPEQNRSSRQGRLSSSQYGPEEGQPSDYQQGLN